MNIMDKKKTIIKGIKKSLKDKNFSAPLFAWRQIGLLIDCMYCPCNQGICSGECAKVLKNWYEESEK